MKKLAFSLSAMCCFSASHGQPIDAAYGRSVDVVGLTMILTDTELADGTTLTEEQLPAIGCTYRVSDPALMSQVLDIVGPGRYGMSTVPVRLRHAIYLSMRDQAGAKYLFAEQQGTYGTVGSIQAPSQSHTLYYLPRRDMPDRLRAWVRDHITKISFTPPKSDPGNLCTFAR